MSHNHNAEKPQPLTLAAQQIARLHTTPGMVTNAVIQTESRAVTEKRLTGISGTDIYQKYAPEATELASTQKLELLPTDDPTQLKNRLLAWKMEHGTEYVAFQYQYPTGQKIPGAVRYIEVEYPLNQPLNGVKTALVPSLIGFVSGVVLPESEDHGSFGTHTIAYTAEQQRLLAAAHLVPQAVVELLHRAGSRCGSKGENVSVEDSIDHVLTLVQVGHETAIVAPESQAYVRALDAQASSKIAPLTHRIHSADPQTIFRLLSGLGDTTTLGGVHHGFFFLNPLNVRQKLPKGAHIFLVKDQETNTAQTLVSEASGKHAVLAVEAGMQVELIPSQEAAGHDFVETIETTIAVANQGGTLADLKQELPPSQVR